MDKLTLDRRENMLNRFAERKTFLPNVTDDKTGRFAWLKTYYHMSLIGNDNFGAKVVDIYLKHA